MLTFVEDA